MSSSNVSARPTLLIDSLEPNSALIPKQQNNGPQPPLNLINEEDPDIDRECALTNENLASPIEDLNDRATVTKQQYNLTIPDPLLNAKNSI